MLPPENPAFDWVRIGDVLREAQYGVSIDMNEDGNGYPIYRMNEIDHMLCIEEVAKCAALDEAEANAFVLADGDVLFNRTNSQEFVGRTGLFKPFSADPCIFASYLIRLQTRPDQVLPEYLVAFLNATRGVRDVKRRARISINQSNVNAEEVKAVRIPLLSMPFQQQIKTCFDRAHQLLIYAKQSALQAEAVLLESIGLKNWSPPEPLTYVQTASAVLAAGRYDAEFFAPRVRDLLMRLQQDHLTIGTVAPPRHEPFVPNHVGDFDYIEIGGLRGDGSAATEVVPMSSAPSRAKWHVHGGDVITSMVRPIRRLSAMITAEQSGAVCSSGFVVLRPEMVPAEVLLTFLRLRPVCELMDLHTSASMYPAIAERDLLGIPFRRIEPSSETEVVAKVRHGKSGRERARTLLDRAKKAVEIAVDHGEEAAIAYLSKGEA